MRVNLPVTQIERDYPSEERLISETDLRGIVTKANASFCDVAGYSQEELVGQPHNVVRHPDMPPEAFADMWRTIQAGERWVGLVKNRAKNGDHYWVKAFVSPMVQDGEIIGYRSVRRKPTREEIEAAEALYSQEDLKLDTLGSRKTLGTDGAALGILFWPGVISVGLALAGTLQLEPFYLWLIAALGGVVGLLFAWRFQQNQVKPLQEIARAMEAFERGDLTARIELYGKGPLAKIARSMNLALDGVELAVAEISQMLAALSRGEFGRRIVATLPGELGRIKEVANEAMGHIEETVTALNEQVAALAQGELQVEENFTTAEGRFREAQENTHLAATRLATLLREVVASTQALARCDLTQTVQAEASGELKVLADEFNAALQTLAETLVTLRDYANQVAHAAVENSQATEQIAAGADEQLLTIEQVSQSVKEAGETISHLAHDAELAAKKTTETVKIVKASRGGIEQMVEAVQAIADSSEQIMKATSVIEEIAKETNLLALNAAIEAARAGEHGRGFAVVAAEVGQLANTSGRSAQEIGDLLAAAMAQVKEAAANVVGVKQEMDRIEGAATEGNDLLTRIAAAMEQQGATLELISEHSDKLTQIAHSNAAATEELAASASQLAQIAEAAYAEADRFKVK